MVEVEEEASGPSDERSTRDDIDASSIARDFGRPVLNRVAAFCDHDFL